MITLSRASFPFLKDKALEKDLWLVPQTQKMENLFLRIIPITSANCINADTSLSLQHLGQSSFSLIEVRMGPQLLMPSRFI